MKLGAGLKFTGMAFALLLQTPALAQDAGSFYAGKALNMVVGISAGGGYDQYARLLARHFPKYIPGAPSIVVRNMPGAGSLTAVLYTRDVAPPDGLTVTTFNSGLMNESMSDGEAAKVRFDHFASIGSMARDLRVCYAWRETRLFTFKDFASRQEVVFGGAGPNSSSTNNVAMLRNLFNLNIRIIPAYRGNTEMNLAVERGELDGSCISWSSVPDDWIRNDKIILLARLSRESAPEIPSSVKFLGDMTDNREHKDIIDALLLSGEIGRPFILSRKVPQERVNILRRAFDAAMRDPQLIDEAGRQLLPISPVNGAEAEEIVRKLYAFPPSIVEKAKLAIKD